MDPNAHWRDSARNPRFFILDYRVVLLFLFLIIAPALGLQGKGLLYSFVIVSLIVVFFGVIEYYGFTLSVTFRYLSNVVIAGKNKKARPWWR